MAVEDFRKKYDESRTIQEIRDQHIANFTHLWNTKMKDNWFDDRLQAWRFHGETMAKCLGKLGVDMSLIKSAAKIEKAKANSKANTFVIKQIDRAIKEKGIEVLNRLTHFKKKSEFMRNGLYLIYHGEIAYFISSVINIKGGRRRRGIIIPGQVDYLVRTNYSD